MKIVVIGSSRHIRSETVESSASTVMKSWRRRDGNISIITGAPRDPGYAGRPLREFLENIAFVVRALWLGGIHGSASCSPWESASRRRSSLRSLST